MSKSVHQIEVRGVDKTGAAFQSVKGRAVTTSAQIKKMVGSALAGLGAYMGLHTIKQSFEDLGHLNNTAQKASLSVQELTKATNAFNIMGIRNMNVDQFTKSLMMMEKNTGLTGLEGFQKVVVELSKIPDLGKRSKATMSVFGRSYQEFMPLINAGEEGVNAFKRVMAAVYGVSDAAAATGDAVADCMTVAADWVKNMWYEGLRMVCNWFDEDFTNSGREAAANVCAGIEYYLRRAMIAVEKWFKKSYSYFEAIGAFWGGVIGSKMNGDSWSEAFNWGLKNYNDGLVEVAKEWDKIDAEADARVERAESKRKEARMRNKKLDKNANGLSGGRGDVGDDGSLSSGKASKKIVNDLVMAGSNAALKMQILGPQYQSEAKKQTAFLEKISANTEKTANNTEDGGTGEGFDTVDT